MAIVLFLGTHSSSTTRKKCTCVLTQLKLNPDKTLGILTDFRCLHLKHAQEVLLITVHKCDAHRGLNEWKQQKTMQTALYKS